MERSLLDTDIFSELLRSRNQKLRQNSDAYLSVFGVYTVSAVSVVETIEGFQRLQRFDKIDGLIKLIQQEGHEVLSFDFAAAQIAGKIVGDLHRTGQPIGFADPLIAAIALREGIPLVSGNTKHFERIQALGYDLRMENWRGDS